MTNNTCTRIFPGYPPADQEARDFLTTERTEDESYHWACCFINALFQHINHTLNGMFDLGWEIEKVAREFRILMTAGQTMKQHNKLRRQFYQQVVRIADEKLVAKDVCPLAGIYPLTKSVPQGSSPSKRQRTRLHIPPEINRHRRL